MGFETAKVITEQGLEGLQRYYGTYRAIVVNNIDEEKVTRLLDKDGYELFNRTIKKRDNYKENKISYQITLNEPDVMENYTETEYKWLGKSKDIPLLKITKNNFVISEITYIDSARISTNIDNTVNAEDFFIYPNPTSDYIVVNSNNDNVLKVEVIDAMGKSMIVKEIRNNNFIDIQSLKCGLYFVMIYDENNNLLSRKKIIIKR